MLVEEFQLVQQCDFEQTNNYAKERNINVGEKVMGVFLHISQSFDTGPPEILFETISLINIRKKTLN